MAQTGHAAMSGLSPLLGAKRTSSGRHDLAMRRRPSTGTGALFAIVTNGPDVDQFAIARKHPISLRVPFGISNRKQTLAYSPGFLEVDASANNPIHNNQAIMVQSDNFNRERLLVDHSVSMQSWPSNSRQLSCHLFYRQG
jgi:hypothetical protein